MSALFFSIRTAPRQTGADTARSLRSWKYQGTHVARTLAFSPNALVQLTSRNPDALLRNLSYESSSPGARFTAVPADITDPATLKPAFESASAVVSLVGLLHGTEKQFEDIQWRGAENVARAAKYAGAKLVHLSAIGASLGSDVPYFRTKALGEQAVFGICPDATVLRPSLVFGPGDGFFAVRALALVLFLSFFPPISRKIHYGLVVFGQLSTRPCLLISYQTTHRLI